MRMHLLAGRLFASDPSKPTQNDAPKTEPRLHGAKDVGGVGFCPGHGPKGTLVVLASPQAGISLNIGGPFFWSFPFGIFPAGFPIGISLKGSRQKTPNLLHLAQEIRLQTLGSMLAKSNKQAEASRTCSHKPRTKTPHQRG